jgi:hypothetical protein
MQRPDNFIRVERCDECPFHLILEKGEDNPIKIHRCQKTDEIIGPEYLSIYEGDTLFYPAFCPLDPIDSEGWQG